MRPDIRRLVNMDVHREILDSSAGAVCVDARFFTKAILSLELHTIPGEGMPDCDGRTIRFPSDTLESMYREDPNLVSRAIAHCALHCILGHSAPNDEGSPHGIAEDMAVEYILDSIGTPHLSIPDAPDRMYSFERLVNMTGSPSIDRIAETIAKESRWKLSMYTRLFNRDRHGSRTADDERWKEISKQALTEVEGFSGTLTGRTDTLMRLLRIRNRRRHDYREFLRRFVSRSSLPKEDPDTFDPIYYTLGLQRYGNIPLVDSSETTEDRSVDEFVIVLDTSGSVMKGPMMRFLEESLSAVRQCLPDGRARIHVIQCDDAVRSDTVISGVADIAALSERFEIDGGGGTDFRPAFEYVDSLIDEGELRHLKGMMYFTDGLGTFPEGRPRYDVAFVFCDDGSKEHPIPPWAMKIELTPDDLGSEVIR